MYSKFLSHFQCGTIIISIQLVSFDLVHQHRSVSPIKFQRLQEMKSCDVKPNVIVYNTLLEAMGKAGKLGLARASFEEMVALGLTPDVKTLTALVKIYGKARWAHDALELWEHMRASGCPLDFILYNTSLSMCADIGFEEEAEKLFAYMKESDQCKPDGSSYSAMLNIYGSQGKPDKAMKMFNEFTGRNVKLNVMGCTCLIRCLGKAMKFDDLVRVFDLSIKKGIRPDDRLLSVVSLCEQDEHVEKILSCLQQANPKLVAFIALLKEETSFKTIKDDFNDRQYNSRNLKTLLQLSDRHITKEKSQQKSARLATLR